MGAMSHGGFDALLLLSFGGPEGPADVMPFLENVVRGRNVPRERLLEVAQNYELFGGRSPINDQNRALLAALRPALAAAGIELPLYWGNRNWAPYLADELRRMRDDGVRRALCFVTSAFSSYSGCRQYREDLAKASAEVGAGCPGVDKLRIFHDHPRFVAALVARLREAFAKLPPERAARARLVFSAHSVPLSMATTSPYEAQLRETAALVARELGRDEWTLCFQSRSGPPSQPWLEPDVNEHLKALSAAGARDVVLSPLGFVSDHMEVVYDLDTQAQQTARALGLELVRAATPGVHPEFVALVVELIRERTEGAPRLALGTGPRPDVCALDCCPAPAHPAGRPRPTA